jgi:hypothetical protein
MPWFHKGIDGNKTIMNLRLSRFPTWLGVMVGIILLGAHLSYYAYVVVDDSYISYRYARNFARGDGLLFNPGQEPVEGYSNFLWVVILAGASVLGLEISLVSKVLGFVFAIFSLVGMVLLMHQSGSNKYILWTAALWLAASGVYAVWSMSGMETSLLASLIILSLILLAREETSGRGFASGFILALVALARAEGFIFFFAALAVRILNHIRRQSARTVLEEVKWITAFLLPFGAYLIWRVSYYGYIFPNTAYAKAGGGYIYHTLRGLYYLYQFLAAGGALLVLLIGVTALVRTRQPIIRYGLAGAGFYITLITFAGGDWMPQFRFFAPILPVLCALAAIGLSLVVNLWRRAGLQFPGIFGGLVATLILGLFLGESIQSQEIERTTRKFSSSTLAGHTNAAWLREHSVPGDSLALVDAGILGFETELHIIDMIGLNDSHIAHLEPKFPRGLAPGNGFGKWDVDYVLMQQPTFIQVHLSREKWENRDLRTDWVGTDELINDPQFLASYKYIDDPRIGGFFIRIDS